MLTLQCLFTNYQWDLNLQVNGFNKIFNLRKHEGYIFSHIDVLTVYD